MICCDALGGGGVGGGGGGGVWRRGHYYAGGVNLTDAVKLTMANSPGYHDLGVVSGNGSLSFPSSNVELTVRTISISGTIAYGSTPVTVIVTGSERFSIRGVTTAATVHRNVLIFTGYETYCRLPVRPRSYNFSLVAVFVVCFDDV